MINTDWSTLKTFFTDKNVNVQYIEANSKYYLFAFDGPMTVTSVIEIESPANSDQIDFETNYKTQGNKNIVGQVITQFEKRDKTIKLVSFSGPVTGDGTVTLYLKVPGTPNPTGDINLDGRWISSGSAFFDVRTPGDMVKSVRFVDHDNILGAGIDYIVGSYTDDDAPLLNQGWYIPPEKGEIKADAIGGYGFAPAGFYLMIEAKKGGGITTGTFYTNIEWGKRE